MECSSCSSNVQVRAQSEIDALRELVGAAAGSSFTETIARCAPRFGPYLSRALERLAAAFDRGEASPEDAREIADRLRAAQLPASIAAVNYLARAARGAGRREGSATRDALARCLAPLVALGAVRTGPGPRPFADALRRALIIDDDEAHVVFDVAKQFDRPGDRHYDTYVVLDELWSGSHTPAALRRAVAHRAHARGLSTREHVLPSERFGVTRVPLVTVGDVRIGLSGTNGDARADEVVIALETRPDPNATVANVSVNGTATIGNARARQLAPWLVDAVVPV